MSTLELVHKIHTRAGMGGGEDEIDGADALIGLFQGFRPGGERLAGLFTDLEPLLESRVGTALEARLIDLYQSAGNDRRPQGGRDAYFVVRHPKPIEVETVTQLTSEWLDKIALLTAELLGPTEAAILDPQPRIRVLEGLPPKHPKNEDEKSPLLRFLQRCAAKLLETPALLETGQLGMAPAALRQAYYFVACDPFLRDYLMWPMYADVIETPDPHAAYFTLWQHGVKYRIFQEQQIDLYLPRI